MPAVHRINVFFPITCLLQIPAWKFQVQHRWRLTYARHMRLKEQIITQGVNLSCLIIQKVVSKSCWDLRPTIVESWTCVCIYFVIRSWFAAAPFSTQRTMSSQRGDDLRASNILHNQDQHHPSLIRNVIERVSHCLLIHIYIYVCVCVLLLSLLSFGYIHIESTTPHTRVMHMEHFLKKWQKFQTLTWLIEGTIALLLHQLMM